MHPFPVQELRRQFPALEGAGGTVLFDNAAGAQVPGRVLEAVTRHLIDRNVQRGGPYRQSREVDAMIGRARESVAAFVNARHAEEIAFGLNATAFIRAISLAVGQTLRVRDEIVVSELDHEANVATWLALASSGARIVWWRVREDGRLHTEDLDALIGGKTRLVACTVAANATGSIVDVAGVAARARRAGAEIFLDAVHYAPHAPIDVQAIDCDYLVCSGYKIFAPHMGFAYCRREAIERLPTFREDFIPDAMPFKLEAGTFVYENVAGMEAAVGYLEDLGHALGGERGPAARDGRRAAIARAMHGIAEYERTLSQAMLETIAAVPGAMVHGVTDPGGLAGRTPTLCFTVAGVSSAAIAEGLAARDVAVRSGHMYSPRVMARLGLMPDGAVRASLVHYNTLAEIERFGAALREVLHHASRRSAAL